MFLLLLLFIKISGITQILMCIFRGEKYLELPYVVKGMDVSFSGLLSYIEVKALETLCKYSGFAYYNKAPISQ